jgi:hypothetical protein
VIGWVVEQKVLAEIQAVVLQLTGSLYRQALFTPGSCDKATIR